MRKRIGVIVLLLLCFSLPSFAGGYVPDQTGPNDETYTPPDSRLKQVLENPPVEPESSSIQTVWGKGSFRQSPEEIAKQVVEQLRPIPKQGVAVGIYGGFPTLSYVGSDVEIEAGYTRILSDQRAVIRGAGNIWKSADKYTSLKAGLAIFPDSIPCWGLFVGIEQFITPNVSVAGDMYPFQSGSGVTNLAIGVLGARYYL